MQEVGQTRHVVRVEHVYLEIVLVPDMIPVERNALDDADVGHENGFSVVDLAPETDGEARGSIESRRLWM